MQVVQAKFKSSSTLTQYLLFFDEDLTANYFRLEYRLVKFKFNHEKIDIISKNIENPRKSIGVKGDSIHNMN